MFRCPVCVKERVCERACRLNGLGGAGGQEETSRVVCCGKKEKNSRNHARTLEARGVEDGLEDEPDEAVNLRDASSCVWVGGRGN